MFSCTWNLKSVKSVHGKEAVKNKEKTITNKIPGSQLLKLIHRHCKFMKSKEEECHEIKAIVKELKIGRGGEDVIKD